MHVKKTTLSSIQSKRKLHLLIISLIIKSGMMKRATTLKITMMIIEVDLILLFGYSAIAAAIRKYSLTCLNYHLYITTTRLRRSLLSPSEPIPVQTLPYKTTTCLKRPATTFPAPQKNCLKQTLQNFIRFRNGKQWIKKKTSLRLFFLYCYL